MKKRKLGRTGLEVFPIGFGAWGIGGTGYGPTDDKESIAALDFAYAQGVDFFDTADTYGSGRSEQLIGQVFAPSSKRLKVTIATKAGWDFYHSENSVKNFDPDYIRFACGESLKRLKTDYIDLYQLHNPTLEQMKDARLRRVLDDLKQEGKIRHWGISVYLAREGVAALEMGADTVQAIYNLIDQRIRPELMSACVAKNAGLIVREALASGLLSGRYGAKVQFQKGDHRARWSQDKLALDFKKVERLKALLAEWQISLKQAAIEFALDEAAVSVVIPGIKTAAQLQDHLNAVREPQVTPVVRDQLKTLWEKEELFQTGYFRN